jgi:hypothetical protein
MMPSRLLVTSILVSLASSSAGCAIRQRQISNAATGTELATDVIFAVATVVNDSERSRDDEQERNANVYLYTPPHERSPAPPPSSRDRVRSDDDLPVFDPTAARAAFDRVSLRQCRDLGMPRGYGHAKVLLSPDGRITKVIVDEPSGLDARAAHCVGERLGTVSVAPFRGSVVTMGVVWFVP